jgi:predicted RNA binding protein YcfA (HicA-like mRNA interferase family)
MLEDEGFIAIRQCGSHRFFQHADGRTTIVSIHSGDLLRPLIRKTLKDIGMSVDDYNDRF